MTIFNTFLPLEVDSFRNLSMCNEHSWLVRPVAPCVIDWLHGQNPIVTEKLASSAHANGGTPLVLSVVGCDIEIDALLSLRGEVHRG